MDITDFRSLSTVLCFIALAGVFFWTYHPRSKKGFDEAAKLPFGDDELEANNQNSVKDNKKDTEE